MSQKKSKSKSKDDKRLAKYMMGSTVIFLMFASLFGIYLSSMNGDNSLNYNGFKLSVDDDLQLVYYEHNDENVYFYNLPSNLAYLNISSNLTTQFNNAQFLVFTFNPNATSQLAYYDELRYRFPTFIPAGVGVINNTGDYSEYPVANCDNSTYEAPVVYLKYNPIKSDIYNLDSCIVLEGSNRDFLNFRDYLVYSKLGIIA